MAKFAEKVKKRPLSCLQGHPVPAPARLPEKKPGKLLTPHSQGRKQPRNHGVSCRGNMRAHDFFKSPCLRTDGSRTSSAHHAESRKAEGRSTNVPPGATCSKGNGQRVFPSSRYRFETYLTPPRMLFLPVLDRQTVSKQETVREFRQSGKNTTIPHRLSPNNALARIFKASRQKVPAESMENCTCRCGFQQA